MLNQSLADQHQKILNKIKQAAKKKITLSEKDAKQFSDFISIYFANVSCDDLSTHTLSNLIGMGFSHWQLLLKTPRNKATIKVFNPEEKKDGWESKHTIIQIISNDMPFLVDSLRIALNRQKLTTYFTIHAGGLKIRYGKNAEILNLFHHNHSTDTDLIRVAPIYLEIDRQTNTKTLKRIENTLRDVLKDVALAVKDWKAMETKMKKALEEIELNPSIPRKREDITEAKAFLTWLLDHFTFLGSRDYELITQKNEKMLKIIPNSSLGVLRDDSKSKSIRPFSDLPKEALEVALSNEILGFSQTDTEATVHRDAYSNCLMVRQFNQQGKVIGEHRFIGLYTSKAYNDNIRNIPLIRQKVDHILKKSALPERGHAIRKLLNILETLPRDDLFEGSIEDLFNLSISILHMQERKNIRLFIRKDVFNRYFSCLIYLPKDNFKTELLTKMEAILKKHLHATKVSLNKISFRGVVLARIHYTVRTNPKKIPDYNIRDIEAELAEVGYSWKDGLYEHLLKKFGEEKGNQLINKYKHAFPASYQDNFSPKAAVADITFMEKISPECNLEMSFYQSSDKETTMGFKLFHPEQTIPLSDVIPMLENMGLRVIREEPYQIKFADNQTIWINDFSMEYCNHTPLNIEEIKEIFQDTFYNVWCKNAESDAFNQLVLLAHLNWREISIFRAYAKYLEQTLSPFNQSHMEQALINNPEVTKLLIELFTLKFDADKEIIAKDGKLVLRKKIHKTLEEVKSLDEDRILRLYLQLIEATLRTNYFQKTKDGKYKSALSFKFKSKNVPNLPQPLPMYEVFVVSPDFEGIHLRTSKIARGGLRWSDRVDFRTEILGLVKAQKVKNAVIVPSGAKGGFICKTLPENGTREEILKKGISCYRQFISGLLDLVDNKKNNKIVPPKNTVRYDDDDPYLVVAADKGTATFSDIANQISQDYGFWLDDAFASGGSAGYDHKKMGITARGAWVAVERHFQEMNMNPATTDFTVVGIGDMSGDVFGNGMLLSKHIQLVAAFNHMHIFLDPNPNAAKSYLERKRLFNLSRSTWKDYDSNLISKGGGVHERSAKHIKLTPEVKKLLELKEDRLEPNELIRAILKAPVDLLWNGGIGTYVKAQTESNMDAEDRANDSVRINGNELQCRSVSEGGNLGLTQLARIEFELNEGRINTDFIDNSAGVDCSDHEVNIKILLNDIINSSDFTKKQRNNLLAKMTDEVATLVLRNNYEQNRAISIAKNQVIDYFTLYRRFIEHAEKSGKLDRTIEFLPNDKQLMERKTTGEGLTRPEIAVLIAYSKIILKDEMLNSDIIRDPYCEQYILSVFPTPLKKKYEKQAKKHPLNHEIIATQLANNLVNDMGPIFVYQMSEEFNLEISDIVRAYLTAKNVFKMDDFWDQIDAFDYKIDPKVQIEMMLNLIRVVRRATRWFLRNQKKHNDIEKTVALFQVPITTLYNLLPTLLTGKADALLKQQYQRFTKAGVPKKFTNTITSMRFMHSALNIIEIIDQQKGNLTEVATACFKLSNQLDLNWLREQINDLPVDSHWAVLARSSFKSDLDKLQRALTISVLNIKTKSKKIDTCIHDWLTQHEAIINRWKTLLSALETSETKETAILSVAMRELACLAGHDLLLQEEACDT